MIGCGQGHLQGLWHSFWCLRRCKHRFSKKLFHLLPPRLDNNPLLTSLSENVRLDVVERALVVIIELLPQAFVLKYLKRRLLDFLLGPY